MTNEKKSSAQTLIDYIRESKENPVIIPNGELMKLLGTGNDVYRYQQLRYEIPFLAPDIILERQTSNYLRKEKQPFGFKKLTPKEVKAYKLNATNFRYLTEQQIESILKDMPEAMTQKDKFRILLIIDILLSKNPKNNWCIIAKNLFPSFLAASEDEIGMLFDQLLANKILYKANIKGTTVFKVALTEQDRMEIESFISGSPEASDAPIEIVNVNIARTRPVSLLRKNDKSVKASEAIDLSNKCAIMSDKKTSVRIGTDITTFDEALKVLVDCYRKKEQQLEAIQQDNQKSHEVFETMNASYVAQSNELQKIKDEANEMAAAKKQMKKSIPYMLDQLTSKLLDTLMEFTSSPVSIESTNKFKSNVLASIMDTQQSVKNLLPK